MVHQRIPRRHGLGQSARETRLLPHLHLQPWPEIKGSIFEGQQMHQRPDIIARVFHMKVEALLADTLKYDILGHVDAFVMVKESKKRHLPHIHMLITTVPRNKPRTSTDIDRLVSAENYIALSHHTRLMAHAHVCT